MSTLYVVATPIGNLADITLRALEVLKEVDIVACEDTRRSRILLTHYGISKRLLSCRSHNEAASARGLVKLLSEGKTVAYLSDAGTPGLSDPGAVLVEAARTAGYPVVPIPGASAFAVLISAAGPAGRAFTFEGFFSPKAGRRRRRLSELLDRGESFVVYESPFRVLSLMADLAELDGERRVLLGREMTKEFEEFIEGSAAEVLKRLQERDRQLGEFAVLVYGAKKS